MTSNSEVTIRPVLCAVGVPDFTGVEDILRLTVGQPSDTFARRQQHDQSSASIGGHNWITSELPTIPTLAISPPKATPTGDQHHPQSAARFVFRVAFVSVTIFGAGAIVIVG